MDHLHLSHGFSIGDASSRCLIFGSIYNTIRIIFVSLRMYLFLKFQGQWANNSRPSQISSPTSWNHVADLYWRFRGFCNCPGENPSPKPFHSCHHQEKITWCIQVVPRSRRPSSIAEEVGKTTSARLVQYTLSQLFRCLTQNIVGVFFFPPGKNA